MKLCMTERAWRRLAAPKAVPQHFHPTKSMVDSIQGLRPDGRVVAMGADVEPLSISLTDLILKRIRIMGSQQNGPEYLYEALDFVAQGKVKTIAPSLPVGGSCRLRTRGGQSVSPAPYLRCNRGRSFVLQAVSL